MSQEDQQYSRLFDELQQAEAEIRDLERQLQACRTEIAAHRRERERWAQRAEIAEAKIATWVEQKLETDLPDADIRQSAAEYRDEVMEMKRDDD